MKKSDLQRALGSPEPDDHMKLRLNAGLQGAERRSFAWGRWIGTAVATCMLVAMIVVSFSVWNAHNAPAPDGGEPEVYLRLPGADGGEEPGYAEEPDEGFSGTLNRFSTYCEAVYKILRQNWRPSIGDMEPALELHRGLIWSMINLFYDTYDTYNTAAPTLAVLELLTQEGARIPYADGTNDDFPVLRYPAGTPLPYPERVGFFSNSNSSGSYCITDDRYWVCLDNIRSSRPLYFSSVGINGIYIVYSYYADDGQEQEEDEIILSIRNSDCGAIYSYDYRTESEPDAHGGNGLFSRDAEHTFRLFTEAPLPTPVVPEAPDVPCLLGEDGRYIIGAGWDDDTREEFYHIVHAIRDALYGADAETLKAYLTDPENAEGYLAQYADLKRQLVDSIPLGPDGQLILPVEEAYETLDIYCFPRMTNGGLKASIEIRTVIIPAGWDGTYCPAAR